MLNNDVNNVQLDQPKLHAQERPVQENTDISTYTWQNCASAEFQSTCQETSAHKRATQDSQGKLRRNARSAACCLLKLEASCE
jgi:hypothetical protein